MKNITGPPVIGNDFFGREDEFEYVWQGILNGNNFIFPSPRRVGKTSFAFKLINKAKEEGWNTIDLNLEELLNNEIDFLEAFIKKLQNLSWWKKVKKMGNGLLELVSQLKPSMEFEGVEAKIEWERKKENIYAQVADLLYHEADTLIFFDELTILLNKIIKSDEAGIEKVKNFLHWLRALRQRKGTKIRWIFCSSVGIENFTHQHGISDSINDILDFNLHSFTIDKSKEMLIKLGEDNKLILSEDVVNAIVLKLDYCLPFFLQIIFEKIRFLNAIEKQTMDVDIVINAYNVLVEDKHFNTWIERIKEQYVANETYAFAILKQLCQQPSGMKRDSFVNSMVAAGLPFEKIEEETSLLIYMLKNDGYIMEENSVYRFRSPLLRDFWFNRFVK